MGWFREVIIVGGGAVCSKMIDLLKNGAGELAGATAKTIYGLCAIVGIWGFLTGGPKTPPQLPPPATSPPAQQAPRPQEPKPPGTKNVRPERAGNRGMRRPGAGNRPARPGQQPPQPGFVVTSTSRGREVRIISPMYVQDAIDV
jgi:hypothetical protein